jgi:hypothetical protein
MRIPTLFSLATLLLASCAPAFAADAMAMSSGSMMMKPGDSMMMKPDGTTMMMPADPSMKMDAGMMAAAKPMDACMIMMMGKDGKMMMVQDMKMADGKMACDELSMMKK